MAITATSQLSNTSTAQGVSNSAAAKLSENFDMFLKLLTTQLQNQDPMEPMDNAQFTQQLVQYSSVEQAIQQNKNLESLIGMFQTQGLTTATSYIGKEVTVQSDTAFHSNNGAHWIYSLEAPAEKVSVVVLDAKGQKVYETTAEGQSGEHNFVWDGRDKHGNVLPQGFYKLQVSAVGQGGANVNSSVYLRDTVTSVEVDNGQPVLVVSGMPVTLDRLVIINSQSGGQSLTAAANYLGKEITAQSPYAKLDEDSQASWLYKVGNDATGVTLTIKDASGKVVRKTTGSPLPGEHTFQWDGKDDSGTQLPAGTYSMSITATNASGGNADAQVLVRNRVERIEMQNGTPMLIVSGTSVRLDQIITVNNA